jgi:hypothetical protein
MLTNYSKQEEPAAALEQSASKNAVVTEKLDLIEDPTRIKRIIAKDDNTMILKFTAIGQLPVTIKLEKGFTGQGHAYIRKINVQGPFVLQGQSAAEIRPIILNHVQDATKGLRKEASHQLPERANPVIWTRDRTPHPWETEWKTRQPRHRD